MFKAFAKDEEAAEREGTEIQGEPGTFQKEESSLSIWCELSLSH